jgi:hypothetical protein
VFNSSTNCLGPRKLLYSGNLKKVTFHMDGVCSDIVCNDIV